jgi:hypothetical protein
VNCRVAENDQIQEIQVPGQCQQRLGSRRGLFPSIISDPLAADAESHRALGAAGAGGAMAQTRKLGEEPITAATSPEVLQKLER